MVTPRLILTWVISYTTFLLSAFYCVADENYIETNQWVVSASIGVGETGSSLSIRDSIPLYILPDIRYYGENLSIENTNIGYALKQTRLYQIEIIGRQNYDGLSFHGNNRKLLAAGREQPRDPRQKDLEPIHRSMSYMSGFSASVFLTNAHLQFDLTKDISNVHRGSQTRLSYSHYITLDDWNFVLTSRINLKSNALIDYYYSTDGSPLKGSNISYRLEFQGSKKLSESLNFVGAISLDLLSESARKSDITKTEPYSGYFLGVKWIL